MIKPILFNTEMVRAILDGRKTVTRRIVKPLGLFQAERRRCWKPPYNGDDVLWVRETWNYGYIETADSVPSCESWFEPVDYRTRTEHSYLHACSRFWYRADMDNPPDVAIPWRPSIHMPREAARIWLRVKNVSVEQLTSMRFTDLVEEGFASGSVCEYKKEIAALEFSKLWNSTIKPADRDRYSWDANPWVWRIAFERCEKPEGFDG